MKFLGKYTDAHLLLVQDMNVIVTSLKMKLGAHGWGEVLRRDKPRDFAIPQQEVMCVGAVLSSFTCIMCAVLQAAVARQLSSPD